MIETYGILTLLEAKPGKGDDLNAFLKTCRAVVAGEAGTISWYAFKLSDTVRVIQKSGECICETRVSLS